MEAKNEAKAMIFFFFRWILVIFIQATNIFYSCLVLFLSLLKLWSLREPFTDGKLFLFL